MARKPLIQDVYLIDPDNPDAEPTCHRVRIMTVDMVIGERELVRLGIDATEHRITAGVAFAWNALRRSGAGIGDFEDFLDRCDGIDQVEPEETAEEDPTQQAPAPGSP